MMSRGILLLFLLAASAFAHSGGGASADRQGREERGKFRLSFNGKEAGSEEYRLEEFEDGKIVLFSKARYEVEIPGGKRAHSTDTVLTMNPQFAPALYAGLRKAGREEDQVKIEWSKGTAVSGRKQVRTAAAFLLDSTVISHLIPMLRRMEGDRKTLKVFNPNTLSDFEVVVQDKGEVLLRGRDATVRAREFQVGLGYITYTAHVDEKKRLLRAWSAVNGALAELEGFEGWAPEGIVPEGVEEQEVAFQNGAVRLAGTFTKPRGAKSCPAVVILSGTGPQDRNGALVRGKGGSEEFAWQGPDGSLSRAIAAALAGAGVASLRYDDRGCGASQGDFGTARFGDLAADAGAAVLSLRARDDVSSVGIIGHGEGALIASVLASGAEPFKAIFLLAPPAVKLDRILLDRAERSLREQGTKDDVIARILSSQIAVFQRIKDSDEDYLVIDERRTFVGWMRERLALDPRATLAKVKVPVVICQGGRDRESPAGALALLKETRPEADVRLFGELDHAFIQGAGRVDDEFLKHLGERAARHLK